MAYDCEMMDPMNVAIANRNGKNNYKSKVKKREREKEIAKLAYSPLIRLTLKIWIFGCHLPEA